MSTNRFLEYIISNYNRFALETTNTMSNYIDLQNRIEGNLSRIIRSQQEQSRLDATERIFAEYNISMDNLRKKRETQLGFRRKIQISVKILIDII